MDDKFYSCLERIETKLDDHIERIVRVEEQVKTQGGAIKLALSGVISVVTSIVVYTFTIIFQR